MVLDEFMGWFQEAARASAGVDDRSGERTNRDAVVHLLALRAMLIRITVPRTLLARALACLR